MSCREADLQVEAAQWFAKGVQGASAGGGCKWLHPGKVLSGLGKSVQGAGVQAGEDLLGICGFFGL